MRKKLFAKYSNFYRIWNCTVTCSPVNNVIKVGKQSRKYVILRFSLFFRFFIKAEYIWLSCFVLHCTTLRELILSPRNLFQIFCKSELSRIVQDFWLFDLRCHSISVVVRRKLLNIFFVKDISSIHKDTPFILINAKMQKAFISPV